MSLSVCVGAYSLRFLEGGAYTWVFLNWALGLRSLGCRVIWLDSVLETTSGPRALEDIEGLRRRLEPYGLAGDIAVIRRTGEPAPRPSGVLDLDAAAEADLFLDLGYDLHRDVVKRFRRSVFVDIDPGLTQTWMSLGQLQVAPHDLYFTYGETVAQPGSRIADCGIRWQYTPQPVFLPAWPVQAVDAAAPYTTVTSWWGIGDWIEIDGTLVDNRKRTAFLEYLDLPTRVSVRLELALPVDGSEETIKECKLLERHGWSVRHVFDVSGSPDAYRDYVGRSRGKFACMKPGYRLLDTAWISERAPGYLASGKPVIVQHTGASRMLPEGEGLLRFRTPEEAARQLVEAETHYHQHSRAARALAEERFDATKIARGLLERAL